MLRKTLLLAAALLSITACLPAWGNGLVEVDVIDRDTGQWLPESHARGRTWVAGTPGHRYAVRLTNTTGERVLVVLSVDGVNAVSGETAHPAQTGYVLAPWQSTEVNGWRKSLDDVAQFVFTDLPDSYAARTGRPDNVGVIGIAVFREARPIAWEPPSPPPPVAREGMRDEAQAGARSAAKATPPREAASAESANDGIARQSIGTGHGAREWSPVGRTDFVRATRAPEQVTELRYDDLDTLVAMGVLPRWQSPRYPQPPRAFPDGFVPDPPR
ncbi:MAG TPA: hypothetical protein VFF93_07660 [Luteimonas sp.]|nr:hypothetical protein [Luteimonas sp.]